MAIVWIWDSERRRAVKYRNPRCAACATKDKLVIDHDRWYAPPYPSRVLCQRCNTKKGSRQYISFPDGIWKPGMRPRPRPLEPRKAELELAGYSYSKLAATAGVTYSMAWKWMNGERVSAPCARAFRTLTGRDV